MKFHIEDDTLTLTLQGGEVLAAVKRRLAIPREAIGQAVWQEDFVIPRGKLGFRIGTALPGYLFAGTFLGPDGRNFLYLQQAQGLFGDISAHNVLQLELHDHPYARVLVTIDNTEIADEIIGWATRSA